MTTVDWFPVAARGLPAARCAVCGGEIEAGRGLAISRKGVTFRLRCADCLEQFMADPDRYADHPAGCCNHQASAPASEWTCD